MYLPTRLNSVCFPVCKFAGTMYLGKPARFKQILLLRHPIDGYRPGSWTVYDNHTGTRVQLQAMECTIKVLTEICRWKTSISAVKVTGRHFEQYASPGWSSRCDGKKILVVNLAISSKRFVCLHWLKLVRKYKYNSKQFLCKVDQQTRQRFKLIKK